MSDLDVDAIRQRAEAATPGPWEADISDGISQHWSVASAEPIIHMSGRDSWGGCDHGLEYRSEDAEFIAHAREDIPALLSALEEKDAKIAELKEACESHEMLHAFATGQIDGLREQIADLRSALEPFAVENGDEQERTAWRAHRYLEGESS